ncbi:hypothetical protein [Phytoactinopolyspora endophytica]|uniref:hypothetical protein n=1 Tax=Phytoactinopolyspora endophytica TaxID=1642495 RepID=UPI00101CD823|nr:hypothetical protein [Phytoactinopolyspora endophytica]
MAELGAEFPWGVLLMTDSGSSELIPEWSSPGEQVTAAPSAMVVRVRHADEGGVSVRLWADDGHEASGILIFEGSIELPSGVLRASDALAATTADLELAAGIYPIRLFADLESEASAIDIVLE